MTEIAPNQKRKSGRKKAERTGDDMKDPIWKDFEKIQAGRFLALVDFRDLLLRETTSKVVIESDVDFKRLLHIACEIYGVKKNELAKRLNTAPATVGRWVDPEGPYPDSYKRPSIIKIISEILSEHIEKEARRKVENDKVDLPTLLKGRIWERDIPN